MDRLKLLLVGSALLATSLANADLLYGSSFESPTFTAGSSVAGAGGWYVGSSSDTASQTITSARSSEGTQALEITNVANTGYYSVGHSLPNEVAGFSPFTVSVDLFVDESTAASRTYELLLMNSTTGNIASSNVLLGINLGGDGKVRASSLWSTLYSTNGQRVTAAAGTYKNRWVNLSLSVDENRTGIATISGLGGVTNSYSYTIANIGWDASTNTWKSITGANLVADNTGAFGGAGKGTFDNFRVTNPVPEPASIAALGLGALALIRRRRQKKSSV